MWGDSESSHVPNFVVRFCLNFHSLAARILTNYIYTIMLQHTLLSGIPRGLPSGTLRSAVHPLSSSLPGILSGTSSLSTPSSFSHRSFVSMLSKPLSSSLSLPVSTVLTNNSCTDSNHRHPSWTPSTIITIPKRNMGIMDRLQSFASGKKQEVIDAKGGK